MSRNTSHNIAEFLRARLDDDEQTARGTTQPDLSWQNFDMDGELRDDFNAGTVAYIPREETRAHIARHDPARVLADVASKRAMVDEHQDVNDGSCGTCVDGQWGYPTHGGSTPQRWPCRTLRLLAAPYRNHPDYREEWRPCESS